MEYKPHDYQQFAINYILEHPIAAVILGMGLGKTSITLTAIEQLIYDSFEVSKVLVVAPLRVARNTWSDEIHKWNHLKHLRYSIVLGSAAERKKALEADADIYIINRENLQWLIEQSGVNFFWDMVVLDELSSFKNWNCKRFKAFMKVRPNVNWYTFQQWTDGSVCRIQMSGYGRKTWKIYQPVSCELFCARQDEWSDCLFL